MAVEIADRHDPRRVVLPDARQIVAARDAPVADRADVDAIARRDGAEHRRRARSTGNPASDRRRAEAVACCREELTPGMSRHVAFAPDAAGCTRRSGQTHALRLLLRLEHQLGGQEAVRLRHRRLGAVEHVGDELRAVGQRDVAAVDVARLLLVDEEQVAAAGPAGDVDVLADLDEAVGAEDGQPAVAPGGRPSGVNQSTRM